MDENTLIFFRKKLIWKCNKACLQLPRLQIWNDAQKCVFQCKLVFFFTADVRKNCKITKSFLSFRIKIYYPKVQNMYFNIQIYIDIVDAMTRSIGRKCARGCMVGDLCNRAMFFCVKCTVDPSCGKWTPETSILTSLQKKNSHSSSFSSVHD